jgi:hypothetical protein
MRSNLCSPQIRTKGTRIAEERGARVRWGRVSKKWLSGGGGGVAKVRKWMEVRDRRFAVSRRRKGV